MNAKQRTIIFFTLFASFILGLNYIICAEALEFGKTFVPIIGKNATIPTPQPSSTPLDPPDTETPTTPPTVITVVVTVVVTVTPEPTPVGVTPIP